MVYSQHTTPDIGTHHHATTVCHMATGKGIFLKIKTTTHIYSAYFDHPGFGSTTEKMEPIPVLWTLIRSPDIGTPCHHCLPNGNEKGIFSYKKTNTCVVRTYLQSVVFFQEKLNQGSENR
jgi:hypothetical protein